MAKWAPYGYLGFAIAGLVITWIYNVQFIQESGSLDLIAFFAAGFVNPAAASLTTDVGIAAATGVLFFVVEGPRAGVKHAWLYALLAIFVAFSFALGLFLFMRERQTTAGRRAP